MMETANWNDSVEIPLGGYLFSTSLLSTDDTCEIQQDSPPAVPVFVSKKDDSAPEPPPSSLISNPLTESRNGASADGEAAKSPIPLSLKHSQSEMTPREDRPSRSKGQKPEQRHASAQPRVVRKDPVPASAPRAMAKTVPRRHTDPCQGLSRTARPLSGKPKKSCKDLFDRLHHDSYERHRRNEESRFEHVLQRKGLEEDALKECTFEPNMERRANLHASGGGPWDRLFSQETTSLSLHRRSKDDVTPGPGSYSGPLFPTSNNSSSETFPRVKEPEADLHQIKQLGPPSGGGTPAIPTLRQAQRGSERSSQASSTHSGGGSKGLGHSAASQSSASSRGGSDTGAVNTAKKSAQAKIYRLHHGKPVFGTDDKSTAKAPSLPQYKTFDQLPPPSSRVVKSPRLPSPRGAGPSSSKTLARPTPRSRSSGRSVSVSTEASAPDTEQVPPRQLNLPNSNHSHSPDEGSPVNSRTRSGSQSRVRVMGAGKGSNPPTPRGIIRSTSHSPLISRTVSSGSPPRPSIKGPPPPAPPTAPPPPPPPPAVKKQEPPQREVKDSSPSPTLTEEGEGEKKDGAVVRESQPQKSIERPSPLNIPDDSALGFGADTDSVDRKQVDTDSSSASHRYPAKPPPTPPTRPSPNNDERPRSKVGFDLRNVRVAEHKTVSSWDSTISVSTNEDHHSIGEVARMKCIDCGMALPSELPYCPATGKKHPSAVTGGRCVILEEMAYEGRRKVASVTSASQSCISMDDTDAPTAVDQGSVAETEEGYKQAIRSICAQGYHTKSIRELLANGSGGDDESLGTPRESDAGRD
eukprot:Sspe_Gene.20539::Locus_7547_Transcript_9_9_Confidence_0.188_Length_2673::g.20539::m.20539